MPATRNKKNFKQPNFIPQETKKKEQNKAQDQQNEGNNKDQSGNK